MSITDFFSAMKEVGLEDRALRIVGLLDSMHTVTVDAHRLVGFLIWCQLLEEDHSRAVEVGHIGVEDVGAETVRLHQIRVGVTLGADLW